MAAQGRGPGQRGAAGGVPSRTAAAVPSTIGGSRSAAKCSRFGIIERASGRTGRDGDADDLRVMTTAAPSGAECKSSAAAAAPRCAVVVCYRPDAALLDRMLAALVRQVDRVLLIANDGVAPPGPLPPGVEMRLAPYNLGLAAAYNLAARWAAEAGATHLLLLDQDSVPAPDMVDALADAMRAAPAPVAAAGALWHDRATGRAGRFVRIGRFRLRRHRPPPGTVIETDFLMSSGSLVTLAALAATGPFDEALFIDHVDTDWCLRARAAGWALLGVAAARLEHGLGDGPLPGGVGRLLPGLTLYEPERHYYLVRNSLALWRRPYVPWPLALSDLRRTTALVMAHLLLAPARGERLRAVWRGLRDGIAMASTPAGAAPPGPDHRAPAPLDSPLPSRSAAASSAAPGSACDVVVVNYNAGPFLAEAVDALIGSAGVARVIVVDNASSDGSLDTLPRAAAGDRLMVIRNDANLGFAAAVNIGLARMSAPFVLLFNPDGRPLGDAVAHLIAVLEQHPEAGMSGPLLLDPDGSEQPGGRRAIPTPRRTLVQAFGLQRLARRFPAAFPDFGLHDRPLPPGPEPVEAISGACMMTRRDAIAAVGPMDDGYFLHCEDLDWCVRFQRAGFRILFVPTARVVHQKGVSSRGRPVAVEWHKHRGMLRFYRKFFRHEQSTVTTLLVTVAVWLRFAAVATRRLTMGRR